MSALPPARGGTRRGCSWPGLRAGAGARAHSRQPAADHRRSGQASRSRCSKDTPASAGTSQGDGELPAVPGAAEHRSEAARRGDAPARRSELEPASSSASTRRSRRSTCRAPRPSGSTPRCSRPIRTTRATIRCSTSWRAPTRPPGKPEQALATLDRIVAQLPADAATLAEVQFRRGELLFSAKRYAEAEAAYAAVIGRGRHAPTFYQQSLYKHGWSLFKQSQNERACRPSPACSTATLVDRKPGTPVQAREPRARRPRAGR